MKTEFQIVQRTLTSVLLLAIFLLVGCGGENYGPIGKIQGKLDMDGNALPKKTKVIFMHPTAGHAGFGFTDADGNFSIEWRRDGKTYEGMPAGSYQVMIVASSEVDTEKFSADEMLEGNLPEKQQSLQIPPRYLRAASSGLVYEVEKGENNFNISITQK